MSSISLGHDNKPPAVSLAILSVLTISKTLVAIRSLNLFLVRGFKVSFFRAIIVCSCGKLPESFWYLVLENRATHAPWDDMSWNIKSSNNCRDSIKLQNEMRPYSSLIEFANSSRSILEMNWEPEIECNHFLENFHRKRLLVAGWSFRAQVKVRNVRTGSDDSIYDTSIIKVADILCRKCPYYVAYTFDWLCQYESLHTRGHWRLDLFKVLPRFPNVSTGSNDSICDTSIIEVADMDCVWYDKSCTPPQKVRKGQKSKHKYWHTTAPWRTVPS